MDAKRRVLIADDSPFFRNYLSTVLEEAGYEVTVASDGAELLARVEQHGQDFAFVLADVVMPGANAFQYLPMIRRAYSADALPVIVISGLAELEDIRRLRGLGANGYLHKQATAETILFRIKQLIQQQVEDRRRGARCDVDVPRVL